MMPIPKMNFVAGRAHGPGLSRHDNTSEIPDEERRAENVLAGRQPDQHALDQHNDHRYQSRLDSSNLNKAHHLNLTTASHVEAENVDWIYPDFLAKGELTLIAGPTGIGKSTIACYLAAAMSCEDRTPFNRELKPISSGNVVYISTEDDLKSSIKPRLMAAGANLDHILYLDVVSGKDGNSPFSFSNKEDIERLVQLNRKLEGTLNLIIVDPIYFAVDGDFTSNAKARQAFENLRSIAQLLNCAILGIAHTVKSPKGKGALERITSPAALREVPRLIFVISKVTDGPSESGANYVIARAKNSLGKPGGGLGYDICETDISDGAVKSSTIFEIKDILSDSADDILLAADKSKRDVKPRKLDIAKNMLLEQLEDGSVVTGRELIELANQKGISENTLKTAKQELGVKSRKRQGDGITEWFMNSQPLE